MRKGRSCRELLDDIKEWCGEEIHTLNRKTQDRGMWRTVVKTALDTYGRQAMEQWMDVWPEGRSIGFISPGDPFPSSQTIVGVQAAAGGRIEPASLLLQGTEHTATPPRPISYSSLRS